MARRLGCSIALALGTLTPGLALLAAGAWVHAQGGGWAVAGVGGAALAIGMFVLGVIGAAVRRSPGASPPGA